MANETTIKWLYPPNFKGTFDGRDAYVSNKVKGPRRYSVLCNTRFTESTNEDDELKVKRTDLKTPSGDIPSKLIIEKINYHVEGVLVRIMYNNMNDEAITLGEGDGCLDFRAQGGFIPTQAVPDDGDDGGDIVFSTGSAADGDSYSIKLDLRVK